MATTSKRSAINRIEVRNQETLRFPLQIMYGRRQGQRRRVMLHVEQFVSCARACAHPTRCMQSGAGARRGV